MLCLLVCVPYIAVYMLYWQDFLDLGLNRLCIVTILKTKIALKKKINVKRHQQYNRVDCNKQVFFCRRQWAMATRCEAEKGVTLIQLCSDGTSNTESANRCGVRHTDRRRRKWTFRNIGSSSILLILTWVFIVQCSLSSLLSLENTQEEKAQWEQVWMKKCLCVFQ